MRRALLFPVLTLALVAMAGTTSAQESPEMPSLDEWIGSWTYDHMEGGGDCDWLGDSGFICQSEWATGAGEERKAIWISRWDPDVEAFRSYRFYNTGYADEGLMWADGETWTTVYTGPDGARYKIIQTLSDGHSEYTWHRSLRGGPWEPSSEGAMTRMP